MTAYLIDDEPHSTDVLRVLLEKYCPEVDVRASYNDPEQALAAITQQAPELLFLDIEMPVLNGFELLRRCPHTDFHIIFTTAYDQYAVKAFKFNALDYLLKPIDKEELVHAVRKARDAPYIGATHLDAVQLLRHQPMPERIALPVGQALIFTDVADIEYLSSDGAYVSVFLQGERKPILLAKSLREFEELLNNPAFFRVHNSHLVHLRHIQKIMRNDGGEIIMRNGQSLPVARAKKAALMALIAKV